jgi:hypothetical protein
LKSSPLDDDRLVQGDAQTKNSWAYLEASAQRIDLENDYNVTFASDSDQV